MSSTPSNGDTIIVVVGTGYSGYTVSSISQTGVTWSGGGNGKQVAKSDTQMTAEVWLGTVGSGASKTITINLSGTALWGIADACEYSGLVSASSVLDKTTTNYGNSASPSTGTTGTTSVANELWIGVTHYGQAYTVNTTQSSPTNGYTLLDGASQVFGSYAASLSYLEKIVSSTGTAGSGTSCGQGGQWDGAIATFEQGYMIAGVTRNSSGNALASCTVYLFRTSDKAFMGSTTSDSNGNYSFGVSDNTTQYWVDAYLAGSPDVFGRTDNNLTGS
jgi:hypothetical protein